MYQPETRYLGPQYQSCWQPAWSHQNTAAARRGLVRRYSFQPYELRRKRHKYRQKEDSESAGRDARRCQEDPSAEQLIGTTSTVDSSRETTQGRTDKPRRTRGVGRGRVTKAKTEYKKDPLRIGLFDGSSWSTINRCMKSDEGKHDVFCWYGASLEERAAAEGDDQKCQRSGYKKRRMTQEQRMKEKRLVGTSQGCPCGICQCVHLDPCSDQGSDVPNFCLSVSCYLCRGGTSHFPQSVPQ